MARFNNIMGTIGRTPLIKLNSVTRDMKATVHVKIEYFNLLRERKGPDRGSHDC